MNKQEFIIALRTRLCGLPMQEVQERIDFYVEMIDDRIEEGMTDEEAIAALGSVNVIAEQIIADIPFSKIAKERIKSKRRLQIWEIVLLVLGSPIWVSLIIAALAVIFSLYVILWSVVISIWSVVVLLIACSLGMIVSGIVFITVGIPWVGIVMIGSSIFCAGFAIFLFFGCRAVSKGVLLLTRNTVLGIKKCFVGKEKV